MRKITKFIPTIILSLCILFFWEFLVRASMVSANFLPAPSDILSALLTNWTIIYPHALQTFIETIIGIVIAIFLGVIVAILLDMSDWVRKAVYPLLIVSQTIPMIALAPLLLLWFGFDLLPKVIIVVLSCFFPIAIATVDGFAHIDQDYIMLLKGMNANYWQTMRFVKLPGSLPYFFSGLKIAATYSVTGAIVGEYVGAYQGLGIYMQQVAHSHVVTLVFAVIMVIAVLSLSLFFLVVVTEHFVLPWERNN